MTPPVPMEFLERSWRLWIEGGICMVPLMLVGAALFGLAARLLWHLQWGPHRRTPEAVWTGWIERPETGQGQLGEMIRYTQDEVTSVAEIRSRFAEVTTATVPPVEQRLTVMRALVGVAPLLGLLGTVLGMLTTFQALSLGGGVRPTERVAEGISEALITTETGLLIAIPGYFLAHLVRRRKTEYEDFLARLESCTLQAFNKKRS